MVAGEVFQRCLSRGSYLFPSMLEINNGNTAENATITRHMNRDTPIYVRQIKDCLRFPQFDSATQ